MDSDQQDTALVILTNPMMVQDFSRVSKWNDPESELMSDPDDQAGVLPEILNLPPAFISPQLKEVLGGLRAGMHTFTRNGINLSPIHLPPMQIPVSDLKKDLLGVIRRWTVEAIFPECSVKSVLLLRNHRERRRGQPVALIFCV